MSYPQRPGRAITDGRIDTPTDEGVQAWRALVGADFQPGTRVRRIADGALGTVLAVDPEDGVTVHMDHGSHTLGSLRAWELVENEAGRL